jgi:hypothetical protein
VVVKDGKRGYISSATGEVLVEPQYQRAWIDDVQTGLAACVNDSSKLGFIHVKTGKTVIPFQFDYSEEYHSIWPAFIFNDGYCLVPGVPNEQYGSGSYGLIDVTGKLILPCKYDYIQHYGDGLFKVGYDNKYGICDRNGNFILPTEYDYIEDYDKSGIVVWKDDGKALYDFNGEHLYDIFLSDLEDNLVPLYDPDSQLSRYYKYQADYAHCGVIDADMNIVIPPKWEIIEYLGNNLFLCSSNEISVVINSKGEYMSPKTVNKQNDNFKK